MIKPFLKKRKIKRKKKKKKEKKSEKIRRKEKKVLPVATPFQAPSSKDRGLANHKRLLGEIHTTTRKGNSQAGCHTKQYEIPHRLTVTWNALFLRCHTIFLGKAKGPHTAQWPACL